MWRHAAPAAVLALALAVRLANLTAIAALPHAEAQFHWTESDMAVAHAWSGGILEGDLLGRDPAHAYTESMQAIAPLETWERWWGGHGVFFQAPLYAYFLALVRFLAGDGFWRIALCQLGLGLANVLLVFRLADRIYGRTAAVAAGLGAALYGPFVLFEAFLLRDTLAVTCSLLLLWALARATEGEPWRWLVAGVCFSVSLLVRETTLLFGPFAVLWIAWRLRERRRELARCLLAFCAGAALAISPLVARNVAVGVAPFAISTRGVEALIHGHAAGASATSLSLPPETGSILEESDGHLLPALRGTIASWGGDWGRLLGHEAAKLQAVFSAYEGTDNVSWYYFAERSPVLRWTLGFEVVLALGLVGLWARAERADRLLLGSFLLSTLGGLMVGIVVGRYRLVAAAVLWVPAGATVSWLVSSARDRRWLTAGGIALAAGAVATLSVRSLADVREREGLRAAEFQVAARAYHEAGEEALSYEEMRAGLRSAYHGPDQRELPGDFRSLLLPWVLSGHRLGRHAELAADLEALARTFPDDPDVRHALGVVYRDALGEPDRAREQFEIERRLKRE